MSVDARTLAATVLARVWQEAAYATPTLDAELSRCPDVDRRDAALATELAYGVLRTAGWLEKQVGRHARGDRWRRKAAVRAHMLIAAYSIFFLERVPPFAAVSEAVKAIKADAGTQVAGFANAVLRKLAGEVGPARAPGLGSARYDAAIVEAVPAWLRAALGESLGGDDAARAFLLANPIAPACLCLRGGEDRAAWIERLRAAAPNAEISAGAWSERCIVLSGAGDPAGLPGAGQAWIVQEQGAQLIAMSLGARPGEEVLDACAGRGHKTRLLAELVAPGGAVDAADLHPSKLARLAAAVPAVRDTFAVDWTAGSGGLGRAYRRVLVDAPCSGTGTLRRRPEIAERLAASDPERLAVVQLGIAARAASLLEPGGRMLYAVCSVLRAECETVVEALCRAADLAPCPFDAEAARRIAGDAASFRLVPHVHGTDGYFLASLRRRG